MNHLKIDSNIQINEKKIIEEKIQNFEICENLMSILIDPSLLSFEASLHGISEHQMKLKIYEMIGNKNTMPLILKQNF